jgi:hypothetical protein
VAYNVMIDNSTHPNEMRHPVGLLARRVTRRPPPTPDPRPLAPRNRTTLIHRLFISRFLYWIFQCRTFR